MKKIGVEQIKVLSDPNRLAILSLLSAKEMTTTQISHLLGMSIQNTQYHAKKLLAAELIVQTKMDLVGNLVEKYYKSVFEPGMISQATDEESVEISERINLVFAAMGAIKGILNRGIKLLDEKRDTYFAKVKERPRYPFGANYIVLPDTEKSNADAEAFILEMDKKLKDLVGKHPQDRKEKFALLYAVFPYQ
jgi:DNA-binding transcriptional ArsR family regulator